jgi:N-acetyl-gamma-glutamyl-phosphate reductase
MQKLKVSIIGSTGYAGKELVKILMNHQKVELVHLVSSGYAGKNIAEIFPEFLNRLDKKLINLNLELVAQNSDLVFTALPHTISMDVVPKLLKKGDLNSVKEAVDDQVAAVMVEPI